MKSTSKGNNSSKSKNNNHTNGFVPSSLKFISSCIKTASSGVRSASASVAASISGDNQDRKDQVLWASFDRLELNPSCFKHVLLLGYSNGFQVIDVEDASNVTELVSRHDDPVTFLQMQPLPAKSEGREGYRASHPLLLVVASDESKSSGIMLNGRDGLGRDGYHEPQTGNPPISPSIVRFYSLRSHSHVHVLRFRSTVYMVRCSPQIVAVGLATQIYCFDALTLENRFSVLTYPVPQLAGQGIGVNIGYGPMAVGPRWLAYASDNPLVSSTGRISPQSLTPPLGVSPSTSPGSGSLVARYAMESSKHLAAGLINLGDMGYKTLSRYCQDLMPDGSGSPLSSSPSWKAGRGASHSNETDTAGMVVVKDFVSKAVISQFRAHTSPISALCFDPSGTLLVTTSIHGNNINIFRIMPSCSQSGSGTKTYDWSSSHVHLYKLHRGITSAVIQDICFSNYSQWVAIVSSRGTCHIFVLSPFGGENVLRIQNSHVDGPTLLPVHSLPWWSTSSFLVNHQSFSSLPPSAVTISVVSRIKNSNSGWLNTVSNAASSAAGKVSVPSGAITAVFHSCVPQDLGPARLKKVNALEHLLVYSPCGHVVQYKLYSSFGGEPHEIATRIGPGSPVQLQDEELRVNVESVQWWDVCRRTNWPEREECISGIILSRQEPTKMIMGTFHCENNDIGQTELVKSHEQPHLYLSNAEVQMSTWRTPLWQKSKMSFYIMNLLTNDENVTEDCFGGEIEIENISVQEIEIRWKDLLPVFDHFHRTPDWSNRDLGGERYSSPSSGSHELKGSEDAVILQSKLISLCSIPNSDGGLPRNFYPLIVQTCNTNIVEERGLFALGSPILYRKATNKDSGSVSGKQSQKVISSVDTSVNSDITSLSNGSFSDGRTSAKETESSNSAVTSEASNTSSNRSDLSMNIIDEGPVNDSLDFEQYFQEGYCKTSAMNDSCDSAEAVNYRDRDSINGSCEMEKSEEDIDNDDMLGGVFSFSEEGTNLN